MFFISNIINSKNIKKHNIKNEVENLFLYFTNGELVKDRFVCKYYSHI